MNVRAHGELLLFREEDIPHELTSEMWGCEPDDYKKSVYKDMRDHLLKHGWPTKHLPTDVPRGFDSMQQYAYNERKHLHE
jgi:hypothetical protein